MIKDYKENKITWQAHSVMKINEESLKEGKYPNGQKLSKEDMIKIQNEITNCKNLLMDYGCIKIQLELFT